MTLGERLPDGVRMRLRRTRNLVARGREAPRWRDILTTPPRRDGVAVFYGHDVLPGPADVAFGGMVKFAQLAERMPNEPRAFNLLYLGSSSLPRDAVMLARLARRRRAAFVWNQDGVAYPGWRGPGWEEDNRVPARLLPNADHVVYQSAFCKLSADRFLGPPAGTWEVLHNPVDTSRFRPAPEPSRPLTLLLGGSRYQMYPLEVALRTLALVRRERTDARLLVSGALTFAADADRVVADLVRELGVADAVELVGPYTRDEAPALLRRADILLHPKVNDPCPTTVLEAMACGVPVVYSATGGTPELVGDAGGVGIPGTLDWEQDHPPSPAELAAAVERVAQALPELRASARERAVERFDAKRWLRRHEDLFDELVERRSR
jgi:glycosyltransferase involved in cell wall biosynthesis